MLLTSIALAALMSPAASPAAAPAVAAARGDHGKIAWFEGSFEAALAKAKAENKLVFIDFWTTWCGWCKRLDKDTFSNETVAAEMKDILCLSIDAESETGAPLAKRFEVHGYPALILLAPDGTPEDSIGGYLPPDKFKQEIQRVRAGQGTVSGLRKRVAADPSSLDARFELASKLESLGDRQGQAAQLAEIKKLDPQGQSLPMRRIALQEVREKINAGFQKDQSVDTAPMLAFLAEEKHGVLLFEGWNSMGQMNAFLAQRAQQTGNDADVAKYQGEFRKSLRNAWKYVPADQVSPFGNSLAWSYYEARALLSPEDKAFALEVAERAQAAAKDDTSILDTYACCLSMNGKKDEAIRQVRRCIELEPDKQQWKDRLAELEG